VAGRRHRLESATDRRVKRPPCMIAIPRSVTRWPLWVGAVWLAGVSAGIWTLNRYENAPGAVAAAPEQWPTDSAITRVPGRATLIMLVHPHCACTRASMGELALVMARSQGLVSAYVLFGSPNALTPDWHKTDLWAEAAAIPGVTPIEDTDGQEARRLGAATSGQTLLYDAEGRLQFRGGITDSRGHSGDNAGRSAIMSLLLAGASDVTQTAVFGCPLVGGDLPNG
jgi:hypothetical protein